MRVLLYCYGSRGDVQPYAALAAGLARAGHRATLVAPGRFGPLATAHGAGFAALDSGLLDLLDLPEVQAMYLRDDRPTAEAKRTALMLRDEYHRLYPVLLREAWEAAADGADLVLFSQSNAEAMHQIPERLGAPAALTVLYPFYVPSRHYPSTLLGSLGTAPKSLNRLSHVVSRRRRPAPEVAEAAAAWRSGVLGLADRPGALDYRHGPGGAPLPVLHGFSRHILAPAPDWPATVHTHGAWQLPVDPAWQPAPELTAFLAAGPQPLAVGFGSLVGTDPETAGRHVAEAVAATGHRAVVVTGWGGITIPDPPPEIFVTSDVPYEWLLPRVRLAVHAGGTGTLHTATAAGLPQVACPFHREQLQWSRRLHRIGVAPPPLHQRDLTADRLAAAIREADGEPRYRQRARVLAAGMRGEGGVPAIVDVLERLVTR
ncbi:glycosyltransferase [Actinoplanes sp. RD1]|uniref:glycosyltransferase n=1 Tax=Actinoplanes sp. RD1 TaxID=3064538 RepID=UPI0027415C43|nr:glycosyltransferase [Actinoplanes sp. RD1]